MYLLVQYMCGTNYYFIHTIICTYIHIDSEFCWCNVFTIRSYPCGLNIQVA